LWYTDGGDFMQRYFLKNNQFTSTHAVITGSDVHHIKHVMRFSRGDTVIVCNQEGQCYLSEIEELSTDIITLELGTSLPSTELPVLIDIAQGLIRRERFEYVIQKSMELGVNRLFPIITKRTIIKTDNQKIHRKVERWNAIAKEACEQAHRSKQGVVVEPQQLDDISYQDYDVVLVAFEEETMNSSLPHIMDKNHQRILVVIGPEGGLDEREITYLKNIENVALIGLGKRILRSETASSYVLSVLGYVYEMVKS
jgi:16S rRNA (uracil1498-N3)-methyltransferase